MAFTVKEDHRRVFPLGDRKVVIFEVDEVDNSGDSIDVPFLDHVDIIVPVCIEATVAVRAVPNTITDSQTEDDPGSAWIVTASGTHDVQCLAIGR